jgi:hypothetical protein
MMTNRHKPIEFSGSVAELAVTLGMQLAEVAAAIGTLIEYGHLQQISHGTYRMVLKPAR